MRVALVGMDSVYFAPRLCEVLSKTEGIELAACCDLGLSAEETAANSGRSAQELADQHGAALYQELSDLLAHGDVAAAAVATHPGRAPQVAAQLAHAGKHLYLVKPAAMNGQGVATLRHALGDAEVVAVTGMTYRLQPGVAAAVQDVAEGKIGEVSSLRVMHQHGRLSSWPRGSWYHTEPDLSPALYLGWYTVDVLRWVTGERIAEVEAVASSLADPDSPQPDTYRFVCRLPSGRSASLDIYFGVAWKYPEFEIEILGTGGALRLNSEEGGALHTPEGEFPLAMFRVDLLAHEIERWARACRGEEAPWHRPEEWLQVLEDSLRLADAARR